MRKKASAKIKSLVKKEHEDEDSKKKSMSKGEKDFINMSDPQTNYIFMSNGQDQREDAELLRRISNAPKGSPEETRLKEYKKQIDELKRTMTGEGDNEQILEQIRELRKKALNG